MLMTPVFYRRKGLLTYLKNNEEFENFNEVFKDYTENPAVFRENVQKVITRQMKDVPKGQHS